MQRQNLQTCFELDDSQGTFFDVQTGHRGRLRRRFQERGAQALADYELLEMYLFRTVTRQDTKPLARALIDEFGSFAAVCSQSYERLMKVNGVGERVAFDLKVIEAVAHRFEGSKLDRSMILSNWKQLIRYCRTVMAHKGHETFRVLYLDPKNALIVDEEQANGTANHVAIYPREITKRALELSATAIILVHNHPSGDPTPSQADIDLTQTLEAGLGFMGIKMHDHVVVGQSKAVSMRNEGYI